MKEIILKESRFVLNAVFFTGILFAIFLVKSCKEREKQQELATKWEQLNEARFKYSQFAHFSWVPQQFYFETKSRK